MRLHFFNTYLISSAASLPQLKALKFSSTLTLFICIAFSKASIEIGMRPFCIAYPTKNIFESIVFPNKYLESSVALI